MGEKDREGGADSGIPGIDRILSRAYAQRDAAASMPTKLFGQNATRFSALVRNAVHDGEHYGNIVTYMRLKGMVPPSSQPTPPPPAR